MSAPEFLGLFFIAIAILYAICSIIWSDERANDEASAEMERAAKKCRRSGKR